MTTTVVRPQQPSPAPATEGHPTTQLGTRDRYIDSLLSLALIFVMTYHVFGGRWLPIMFPAMGIMFALAGSVIASSLDRSPGNPWRVLKERSISLLSPMWLFGLVAVPTMLVAGWTHSQTAGVPLNWRTLLFWVVPISDPPGSKFGDDWVTPLWYIRSYLWFLLLSPATLWLFRHWPKKMMALPVSVVLLSALGLFPLDGRSGDVILSTAMFGGCWMLGFAHHDNKIRPLPLAKVLLGGASLMALGLVWAFTHPDPVTGWDIGDIPMANTLYCLGAVLILLRLHPGLSWMDKRVVIDKLVTVVTSRAMTIYLWCNFAIFLAITLLDSWSVTSNLDQESVVGYLQMYLASWLIIIGCVFLFGWCEDLAARRPPRINPWPRSKQQLEIMGTREMLTFARPTWSAGVTPRHPVIVASCLLAAAGAVWVAGLAGTNTPGRTATGDVQSRYALVPRPEAKPPANLGQGNGQESQPSEGLAKLKAAVFGPDKGTPPAKGIPPALTNSTPTQGSRVLPPVAANARVDLLTTTTAPVPPVGVLAPPPALPPLVTPTPLLVTPTPPPPVTTTP